MVVYHGQIIAGGGTIVLPMTRAEYEANKTVLDSADVWVDLTDEPDQVAEADQIAYSVGNVQKSMGYIGDIATKAIAKVEPSDTALYAHAVGEYFINKDGELCRTTSTISINQTITVGTNCAVVTVADEIRRTDTLSRGIEIPSNSNMDNYITPGKYFCYNTATAQTITNAPFIAGYSFEVNVAGSDWIHQIARKASNNQVLERRRAPDTGNWTAWADYGIGVEIGDMTIPLTYTSSYDGWYNSGSANVPSVANKKCIGIVGWQFGGTGSSNCFAHILRINVSSQKAEYAIRYNRSDSTAPTGHNCYLKLLYISG